MPDFKELPRGPRNTCLLPAPAFLSSFQCMELWLQGTQEQTRPIAPECELNAVCYKIQPWSNGILALLL